MTHHEYVPRIVWAQLYSIDILIENTTYRKNGLWVVLSELKKNKNLENSCKKLEKFLVNLTVCACKHKGIILNMKILKKK